MGREPSPGRTNQEQTTRAVAQFARLQLPGVIAGLMASVAVGIFGTGPLKLWLIPIVGAIAFLIFYIHAKWMDGKRRSTSPRGHQTTR